MQHEEMKVLVCSSAHVTEDESTAIDAGEIPGTDIPTPLTWDYGWIFYIGTHGDWVIERQNLSEGFAGAIKYARDYGYEWLRFDTDARALDGVPTYDW